MERNDLLNLYGMLCELQESLNDDERARYRDSITDIKRLLNKKIF